MIEKPYPLWEIASAIVAWYGVTWTCNVILTTTIVAALVL